LNNTHSTDLKSDNDRQEALERMLVISELKGRTTKSQLLRASLHAQRIKNESVNKIGS
jgi:hypothetical protein